jgi:hypothetical protein
MQAATAVAAVQQAEKGSRRSSLLQQMSMSSLLSPRNKVHNDDTSGEGFLLAQDILHYIPETETAVMEGMLLKKQAWLRGRFDESNQPRETQKSATWKLYRVVLTREALYFFDGSQKQAHAALDVMRLVDVQRYGVFKCDNPDQAVVTFNPQMANTVRSLLSTASNDLKDSLQDPASDQEDVGKRLTAFHAAAESKSLNKSCCFDVKTKEQGRKNGRVYHLCVPDSNSTGRRDEWAQAIAQAVDDAHHESHSRLNLAVQVQRKLHAIVIHPAFTAFVGILIAANFVGK